VRLHEPTCTILLFGSGKCVLTGCRDFVSCIRAVYDVLDVLRRSMHGMHFAVETIQMQNIVGHADLELKGQHVDLGRFYADHNIECTFQRTMFPVVLFYVDISCNLHSRAFLLHIGIRAILKYRSIALITTHMLSFSCMV
jgi:TATA-box binding protein (TBP) (component of TFIID and TFIIIB)